MSAGSIEGQEGWSGGTIPVSTSVDQAVDQSGVNQASSDYLPEVAPRELSARTRLQVPLEFDRRGFFIELDHHQRSPGTM
jgi:hypothetical protein